MEHDCHKDGSHFLSDEDREFCYGARNITKDSASNTRTRIRERLRCALDDLYVLSGSTKSWNIDHFARDMDPNGGRLYETVVSSVSLLYSLARAAGTDPERLFTEGIEKSTKGFAEVNVEIDVDYPKLYDFDEIKRELEAGNTPTPWEIGMLFYQGDASEEVTYGGDSYSAESLIREFISSREKPDDPEYWWHYWKDV